MTADMMIGSPSEDADSETRDGRIFKPMRNEELALRDAGRNATRAAWSCRLTNLLQFFTFKS